MLFTFKLYYLPTCASTYTLDSCTYISIDCILNQQTFVLYNKSVGKLSFKILDFWKTFTWVIYAEYVRK